MSWRIGWWDSESAVGWFCSMLQNYPHIPIVPRWSFSVGSYWNSDYYEPTILMHTKVVWTRQAIMHHSFARFQCKQHRGMGALASSNNMTWALCRLPFWCGPQAAWGIVTCLQHPLWLVHDWILLVSVTHARAQCSCFSSVAYLHWARLSRHIRMYSIEPTRATPSCSECVSFRATVLFEVLKCILALISAVICCGARKGTEISVREIETARALDE